MEDAKKNIQPEDQITQCNECQKYLDQYYSSCYFLSGDNKATACDECMNEKQLTLPACDQCGRRAPAKEMYITGSYDKKYFCDYEEQCIYWFNHEGWCKNKGTIKKL